ncbi:MAG: site-2 protease family protein [Candidatus Bathyarchaeota archaeon]|nr:site-2 protease family protein [Candidatus Bathyarchaeota archaeon]
MVQCDYCGRDEYMPFRCKYCGGYFCSEHRLPEMHNCSGNYQFSRSTTGATGFTPTGYSYTPQSQPRTLGIFGKNELRDLGIGLAVIMLILLSGYWRQLLNSPVFLISALLIYGTAFLLHELAHKFMAQSLGYWAEFRINQQGIMITLLSLISPFKIIAPGAVMIGNIASWDHYGKISVAGPATNIGLGLLFLVVKMFTGDPMIWALATVGTSINASLALFNLIPFGVFDGAKIIKWNKYVWGAAVLAAGILYLL